MEIVISVCVVVGIFLLAMFFAASRFYRKVGPEEAIVRSGVGGLRAATGNGIFVIPVIHRAEQMDLSVKRIEIKRKGEQGLICKDNIRADIEVAFFVRVNNTRADILQVAQALGCKPPTLEIRVPDSNLPQYVTASLCLVKAICLRWLRVANMSNRIKHNEYLFARNQAARLGMQAQLCWNGEWMTSAGYLDRFLLVHHCP